MEYKKFKKKLLSNPAFAKEISKVDLNFEISQMIIDARLMRGLTQKQLAKLVGTKQPSIARLESGSLLPSLSFLDKIAKALKTQLIPPKLQLVEDFKVNTNSATSTNKKDFFFRSPGSYMVYNYIQMASTTQQNLIINEE